MLINIISLVLLVKLSISLPYNTCGHQLCFPGVIYIGTGIDLVSGKSRGIRALHLSNKMNKTYTDFKGRMFGYYDDITIMPNPHGVSDIKIYSKSSDYLRELCLKVGAKVGFGLWFSGSAEYQRIEKMIEKYNLVYSYSRDVINQYMISLTFPIEFYEQSDELHKIEQVLPEEYDKEIYKRYVVDIFGTHVVTEVETGGVGMVETLIKTSYSMKYKEETLKASLKIDAGWLKANGEHLRRQSGQTEDWYNSTEVSTSVMGGDSSRLRLKDFDEWLKTIIDNPAKINYKVSEICTLIKNQKKRVNVKRAIDEYLAENQPRNMTGVIKDCNHVEFDFKMPINAISEIGHIDAIDGIPNRAFIVRGPDSEDRCVAAIHYEPSGYKFNSMIYSRTLTLYGREQSTTIYIKETGHGCYRCDIAKRNIKNGVKVVDNSGTVCESDNYECTKRFYSPLELPYLGDVTHFNHNDRELCGNCGYFGQHCSKASNGIAILLQPRIIK